MEINVVRVTKFAGKGGMLGFATIELVEGENKVILPSLNIKEITKDGETKHFVFAAQAKGKDGKYYDQYSVKGPLFWDITNAVMAVYNGEAEVKETPKSDAKAALTETSSSISPAAAKAKVTKKVNPWPTE
jgi:DNA-binding cell septation regulator SpoVG